MKAKKILAVFAMIAILLSAILVKPKKSEALGNTATDSNGIEWEFTTDSSGNINLLGVGPNVTFQAGDSLTIPGSIVWGGYSRNVLTLGDGYNNIFKNLDANSSKPQTIIFTQGTALREIKAKAFYNVGIQGSITIPNSVQRIYASAFENNEITELNLGSSLLSTATDAFKNNQITTLTIPNSMTYVSGFRYNKIQTINWGSNVQVIDYNAFEHNELSGTISIPAGVTEVRNYAFLNNKIEKVELNNATSVGVQAFMNNEIEEVVMGNSLRSIQQEAFKNNKIEELTIGSGVTSIGKEAFMNNKLTGTLTVPGNVTSIGEGAFKENQLSGLVLNEGLQTIGKEAFLGTQVYENGQYISSPDTNHISGTVSLPSTLTSIGEKAFYSNNIDTLNFGSASPTIGNNAFQYNNLKNLDLGTGTGLTAIDSSYAFANNKIENIVFNPNTKTITNNAFYEAFNIDELVIPGTVETIGQRMTGTIKKLVLSEGIKTIERSAFSGIKSLTGDLTIPNSVTSLGTFAFSSDSNVDGVVRVGTGVTTINEYTFDGMTNANRFEIPSNVTNINLSAFGVDSSYKGELGDIFIDNTPDNVTVSGRTTRYIHWRNETHNVIVNTLPGVHIVNAATGAEITTGDYACESDIDVKVVIDDGYTYSDLKLVVLDGDEYENMTKYVVDESETYDLIPLVRNRKIIVQSISDGLDLALRMFISKVNRADLNESREPVVDVENGDVVFKHTKAPVLVKKDDKVTYTIRVYNQGGEDAKASKISVYLPEGLTFNPLNVTNILGGWQVDSDDDSVVYTTKSSIIESYSGNTSYNYKDISLCLNVTKERQNEVQTKLNVIAEIKEVSNADGTITADADSSASITAAVDEDYREREAAASTSESYVRGQEDDDDFESVYLPGKVKIQYDLHLRKADIADEQLLEGAEFTLYNSEKVEITTAVTDENGEINFGTMTSYGEGQDIYFMEETGAPSGYKPVEYCKIKIIVNKTLVNEATGECAVNVVCEKVDYTVNTSMYKFVPVTNKAELKKIGSGDTITIEGKEYVYAADANYKLMNNIDLSGEEWTPIENEIVGIFDGNGKTISGLTITSTGDYDKSEVGLFRVFSGIFENTTFTDVNIDIANFDADADNISGKTGTGTIAGVMREGVIYNVTVSGTVTAFEDNIGGFVGHTMPEKIVRVINCTNNANVSSKSMENQYGYMVGRSNVGGAIGCALGAVSVTGSTNNGTITTTNYNAGGFVGYVEATDYQETLFTAAYKEDNDGNLFTLVARNEELEDGTYTMLLENRDKKTRNLIPNGVYTVYGSDKQAIAGLESVTLTDGTANLGTYTFDTVGKDTYYLKETTPATGYSLLNGYIKVVVTRCWNADEVEFYVTVEDDILSETEFQNDVPDDQSTEVNPKTGKTNDLTAHDNAEWNVNKAEFINCENNGVVTGTGYAMRMGGLVGNAKCKLECYNCENKANLEGKGIGGLAGLIDNNNLTEESLIVGCTNSGNISLSGNAYEAGGLVALAKGKIKVSGCSNEGDILTVEGDTSGSAYAAAGIIGTVDGMATISGCSNEGDVKVHDAQAVGGILGQVETDYSAFSAENREIYIYNCQNTGDIAGKHHLGGIVGILGGNKTEVKNCTGTDFTIKEQSNSYDNGRGGIIGFLQGKYAIVDSCNVSGITIEIDDECTSNGKGGSGGIIGEIYTDSYNNGRQVFNAMISDCNVTGSTIETRNIAGGILGNGFRVNEELTITDCKVNNTEIYSCNGMGNDSVGGIVGFFNIVIDTYINNCIVENSEISIGSCTYPDDNLGGIIGLVFEDTGYGYNGPKGMFHANGCKVIKTKITNNANPNNTSDNTIATGGIAGSFVTQPGIIQNCTVEDNCEIKTLSGNVGGILGLISATSGEVDNCTFDSSKIDSTTTVMLNSTGGIIGYANKGSVDKCLVNNAIIDGGTMQVAGLVGCNGSNESYITNSNVVGSTISNKLSPNNATYWQTMVAGAVGVNAAAYGTYDHTKIDNVHVKNSTIEAKSDVIRFTTGFSGQKGVITNSSVEGCTIKSAYNEDSESITSHDYQTYTTGFCNNNEAVDNCTVKDTNIYGNTVNVSGFAVYSGDKMSNITVENVGLYSNPDIEKSENNQTEIVCGVVSVGGTLSNITVNGLKVEKEAEMFGGIAGKASNMNNCTVNNLTANITGRKASINGVAAGIVGQNGASMTNCTIKDSKITTDNQVLAGLIGCADTNISITDATVQGCELTHLNSVDRPYDGLVSGAVGYNNSNVTMSGVTVKDTILKSNATISDPVHMGGLMGFVDCTNSITDCDVTGTTITNNTTGMTGGVAGMTQYKENDSTVTERTLVINNVTVDGGADTVTISGKNHVGGILGFGKISVTTPVNVKNLVLKTLGTTGDEQVNNVIGVATDHTGESDVTVTNVTIE